MREIKFRAWDGEHFFVYGRTAGSSGNEFYRWPDKAYDDLQQYTGLRDKNGEDIYEGDLVVDDQGRQGLVRWSNRLLRYGYIDSKGRSHSFNVDNLAHHYIVIGNMYETPEFMEAA